MKRQCTLILCIFFLFTVFFYSCSTSSKPYNAPERKDLGDNKFEYIDSPLFEGPDAGAFNPELDSAEAAVAKFLSSEARQDGAWKEALIPESEWSDRLKRQLETWDEWKILKWQLKSIQIEDSTAYLTVYFEIEYDGKTDDGEDDFELVLKNGVWMIIAPPT